MEAELFPNIRRVLHQKNGISQEETGLLLVYPRGVLIIQSPKRSGSLITAYLTADYNRDLFAVTPGKNENFEGNRILISSGAYEVSRPEQILEEWNFI